MKKLGSISLMVMGAGLVPVAMLMDSLLLKAPLLLGSIVLSMMAIVRNIKEKKENQL
jgi:hypothetical protein